MLAAGDRLLHRLGHRDLPGPLRPADPGDRRGEERSHAGLGGIAGRRPGGALLFTGRHTGTVPRTSDTRPVTTRACPASSAERYGRIVRQAAVLNTLLSVEEPLTQAAPGQVSGDHQPALRDEDMIFMQFAALFVIYAGYLTVMVLLPVSVMAVLGVACVRAIMTRGTR